VSYTTFLFDLDHTLLDSVESERRALAAALSRAGIADPLAHFPTYVAINRSLWDAVERGVMSPDDVRVARFEALLEQTGLSADPVALGDDYVRGLGSHGQLFPGTRSTLERLAQRAALGLVTNGIGEVQRARIERLELSPLFETVAISGELGISKPAAAIFEVALRGLGSPPRGNVVMVGDSLSADVQGAANCGIDACWFNPDRRPYPPDASIAHDIATLDELLPLTAAGP